MLVYTACICWCIDTTAYSTFALLTEFPDLRNDYENHVVTHNENLTQD